MLVLLEMGDQFGLNRKRRRAESEDSDRVTRGPVVGTGHGALDEIQRQKLLELIAAVGSAGGAPGLQGQANLGLTWSGQQQPAASQVPGHPASGMMEQQVPFNVGRHQYPMMLNVPPSQLFDGAAPYSGFGVGGSLSPGNYYSHSGSGVATNAPNTSWQLLMQLQQQQQQQQHQSNIMRHRYPANHQHHHHHQQQQHLSNSMVPSGGNMMMNNVQLLGHNGGNPMTHHHQPSSSSSDKGNLGYVMNIDPRLVGWQGITQPTYDVTMGGTTATKTENIEMENENRKVHKGEASTTDVNTGYQSGNSGSQNTSGNGSGKISRFVSTSSSTPSESSHAGDTPKNCEGGERPKTRSKTSKFKGVSWHRRDKSWVARIWHKSKTVHVGIYGSEERAALAVDLKLLELYGKKVSRKSLNFPKDSERKALMEKYYPENCSNTRDVIPVPADE